jgi:acylphosphatase
LIQRRVLIRGRVQGVGFRASLYREAMRFRDLRGHVRNRPDGSVEAIFQGSFDTVEALLAWCHHGPPQAEVEEVSSSEEPVDPGLPLFEVRSDG